MRKMINKGTFPQMDKEMYFDGRVFTVANMWVKEF